MVKVRAIIDEGNCLFYIFCLPKVHNDSLLLGREVSDRKMAVVWFEAYFGVFLEDTIQIRILYAAILDNKADRGLG